MTAQIPDFCLVGETRFQLIDGTIPFRPKDHGLAVRFPHTGCWRGFQATYRLEGSRLLLEALDAAVICPEGVTSLLGGSTGKADAGAARGFTHRFENVALPLRPQGRMVLVADPVARGWELEVPYAAQWHRVLLLIFDHAGEADCLDLSGWAEEARRQAPPRDLLPRPAWLPR